MIILACVSGVECLNLINLPILPRMSKTGDSVCHCEHSEICWPDVKMGIAAVRIVCNVVGAVVSLCVLEGPDGSDGEEGVEF